MESRLQRLWLLFSQIVTVLVAVLFVLQTFKPQWLTVLDGRDARRDLVQRLMPASPPASGASMAPHASSVPGNPPSQGLAVTSYAEPVNLALPSVVSLSASQTVRNPRARDPWYRFFFGEQPPKQEYTSLGSGVIVGEDGHILTNYHVVEDADDIQVTLTNGKHISAKVVGVDPETDLAVLKVNLKGLPAIQLGDDKRARVGDVVLAIGNPYGVGETVTVGIVSALGRKHLGVNEYENFIQTDAAINPGNSGGALINANGQLIGINTLIYAQENGGSVGIGFAIPVSMARRVMQEIILNGRVSRGYLGVELQEITPELARAVQVKNGVVVVGVLAKGPATSAGIEPGDVITAINDQAVTTTDDFTEAIANYRPGEVVRIALQRNGRALILSAKLSERPPPR